MKDRLKKSRFGENYTMRLTIDPKIYGGFDSHTVLRFPQNLKVLLNGEEIKGCVAADDVTGEIWYYKDPSPRNPDLEIVKSTGKVEFILENVW